MKKIFTFITALLFVCLLSPGNNTSFCFYQDVEPADLYYTEIKALHDNNLLPDDTNYNSDSFITLLELYEIIFHYAKTPDPDHVDIPYSNIDDTDIDANTIQQAINYGFLTPTKGQTFNKDKLVSKHHALSLLFESFGIGYPLFFDTTNFPFIDVSVSSYYGPLAMKTAEIGILEEDNPLLFKAAKRITKGEIAHYLYLLKDYEPALTPISIQIETSSIGSNFSSTEKELIENDNFKLMLTVWSRLQENYLYSEDLDEDELILGAINGLVEKVNDPYTDFQDGEEATVILESLNNEYEGVGMIVDETDDGIIVVSPFKDSPAEQAGLEPGDIIIEVDNISTVGQSIEEVVSNIRGPADTKVVIKVQRNNQELTFSVIRQTINFDSVNTEIITHNNKKVGYIELVNFGDNTAYAFKQAALDLASNSVDGVIVDVRNNPGGYLDIAIDIIKNFIPEGESAAAVKLVYSGGFSETLTTTGNGNLSNYEIVVLINEGSASASEILAGALRDLKDATLIGTTSFGKGSVQQMEMLSNNSILKYTISEWLTPNGTEINEIGITPDIIIENTSETTDSQLNRALNEF